MKENSVKINGWVAGPCVFNRETFESSIYDFHIKLTKKENAFLIPVSIADTICPIKEILSGAAVSIIGKIGVNCIEIEEIQFIKEENESFSTNEVCLYGNAVNVITKEDCQYFEFGMMGITFLPVVIPCRVPDCKNRMISEDEYMTIKGSLIETEEEIALLSREYEEMDCFFGIRVSDILEK